VQAHPTYAEAHCNLGVIYKDEGRLEEAIASYESALSAAPEFSIVRNNLAVALTELGTRVKLSGRWLVLFHFFKDTCRVCITG
jgi:protein O-GlcNAc transferase